MNNRLLRNLVNLCLVFSILFFVCDKASAGHGEWARDASEVTSSPGKLKIPAPDHNKVLMINGIAFYVMVGDRILKGTEKEGVLQPAEIIWSPDSSAFVITASDGGAVGTWFISVYLLENDSVRYADVAQEVIRHFKRYYKCDEPEEPNVGAVKWLNDSKQLLLVAEVPPHSTCREMGKFKGYIVDIPSGGILEEIDEKDVRLNWSGYLGTRFIRSDR